MKRIIAMLLVVLSSCSISYKFNGASINYDTTKTISIANFPIKAALVYPPLEELFTNSLKNAYTRQTRLQIVNSNGDLQLEGEITNYDLTPPGRYRECLCLANAAHHHGAGAVYEHQGSPIRPGPELLGLQGLFEHADAHRRAGRADSANHRRTGGPDFQCNRSQLVMS